MPAITGRESSILSVLAQRPEHGDREISREEARLLENLSEESRPIGEALVASDTDACSTHEDQGARKTAENLRMWALAR
jgi:hypothetical protein